MSIKLLRESNVLDSLFLLISITQVLCACNWWIARALRTSLINIPFVTWFVRCLILLMTRVMKFEQKAYQIGVTCHQKLHFKKVHLQWLSPNLLLFDCLESIARVPRRIIELDYYYIFQKNCYLMVLSNGRTSYTLRYSHA